jgi:hypothetical protein
MERSDAVKAIAQDKPKIWREIRAKFARRRTDRNGCLPVTGVVSNDCAVC